MDQAERDELERTISAHREAGELAAATTAAIRGYGPEILGFLFASTRQESDAGEIFSDYCENLWKALPSFRGESTFRTWSYRVAFRSLARARRQGTRRQRRVVALCDVPEVAAIVDGVRSQTLPHLRTEVKEAVLRLREQLSEDDQTLLILRIDRRLGWEEIARIVDPDEPSRETVKRTSATLRKRFERVKLRLRALSKDLLPED